MAAPRYACRALRAGCVLVAVVVLLHVVLLGIVVVQQRHMNPHLRLPVATLAINAVGSLCSDSVWHTFMPLTPAATKQHALSAVGHLSTDFMWDMDGADHDLESFLSYIRAPRVLSRFGAVSATEWAGRALSNRLQLSYHLANASRAAAIAARPVRRPIIVVGMPRSGTTAMHRLLSFLPGVRPLRWYEAMWPAGVPGTPATPLQPGAEDPRIPHSQFILSMFHVFTPEQLFESHDMRADAPEECVFPLLNSLAGMPTGLLETAFGWSSARKSKVLAYRYHKLQLQVMDWLSPELQGGRWLLKAPAHTGYLNDLLSVYPDAQIVWMHRHPRAVAKSYARLRSVLFSMERQFGPANLTSMANFTVPLLRRMLTAGLTARDRLSHLPPTSGHGSKPSGRHRHKTGQPAQGMPIVGRFIDVVFNDLVTSPVQTACQVAQALDLPCSDDTITVLQTEAARSRQKVHRTAPYEPAEFGLDGAAIDTEFQDYIERFNLPSSNSVHTTPADEATPVHEVTPGTSLHGEPEL